LLESLLKLRTLGILMIYEAAQILHIAFVRTLFIGKNNIAVIK
jgi:hypothetical protein